MADSKRWDDEDFDLDNWYERALDNGFGFKSPEERQAYCDSLGDPLKHPMFATSTEDLADHPLTDAFRVLREEDKTLVELALMYKEEGNDWIRKKGVNNNFKESYDRYSHALTFMKKASDARILGNEAEADKEVNLSELCSQILSNRAQASLSLQNYGMCKKDCIMALKLNPSNMKTHFRRCKALYMLKAYDECQGACEEALRAAETAAGSSTGTSTTATSTVDIENILEKARAEGRKAAERKERFEREETSKVADLKLEWSKVWKAASKCKVQLGFHSYSNPAPMQLRQGNHVPHYSIQAKDFCWPTVFLYPQYNQIDVVHAVPRKDMLVEHLAVMFPEPEDEEENEEAQEGRGGAAKVRKGPNPAVPWDRDNEYHVSELVVYVLLQAADAVSSEREWQAACAESAVLHEGVSTRCVAEYYAAGAGAGAAATKSKSADEAGSGSGEKSTVFNGTALKAAISSSGSSTGSSNDSSRFPSVETVRETVKAREVAFQKLKAQREQVAVSSANWLPTYYEVHLGCKFADILSAKHHVVVGGVLSLLIFVRDSSSHKMFLHKNKDLNNKIEQLLPSA